MSQLQLKKQINKEVSNAGLAGAVEGAAIQRLAEIVQQENIPGLVHGVLEYCRAGEGAVFSQLSHPCSCHASTQQYLRSVLL